MNGTSRCQSFPDTTPFNEPLLFTPTKLGHSIQFPNFDTSRAGKYTPEQMKNFWDSLIHASASDTVLRKLTRTILTQGNTVWISDPGNLKCFLSLDDGFLNDHFLTPSYSFDKFKQSFGELGYLIQRLGNFFACFFLVHFIFDVVLIVLWGLETGKTSGDTFGFVRTKLDAIFHLFFPSLKTPLYNSDENKTNGNLRVQNTIGNGTLAASMYKNRPNHWYPEVHIVNNPMPISTN